MVRSTVPAQTKRSSKWLLVLGAVVGAALALGLALVHLRFQAVNIGHDSWSLCPLPLGLGAVVGGLLLPRLLARRRSGGVAMCSHCHAVKAEGQDPRNPGAWLPSHRYLTKTLPDQASNGLCPRCRLEQYAQHLPSAHLGPAPGPPRA